MPSCDALDHELRNSMEGGCYSCQQVRGFHATTNFAKRDPKMFKFLAKRKVVFKVMLQHMEKNQDLESE